MKMWELALSDAVRATEHKPDYAKAHCRVGAAALGLCKTEQAYQAFAAALKEEEKNRTARRGREVCLGLMPYWESQASMRRRARFARDAHRPPGTTRVFALSDVHFDHPGVEEWLHRVHSTRFLDDVLIVAGNVADSFGAIVRGLTLIRGKFRRLFYLPGNHEMWILQREKKRFKDSMCKLWRILELCDDLDIDVFPAAVCRDAYIVPLFSWYNAAFDEADPYPDPKSAVDKHAIWPIDAREQVWRYMMALNREALSKPYHGTVITFSHFCPRPNLPLFRNKSGLLKTVGCAELDEQIRDCRSSAHVYGHTLRRCNTVIKGVCYTHCPLELDASSCGTLTCIFSEARLCYKEVDV